MQFWGGGVDVCISTRRQAASRGGMTQDINKDNYAAAQDGCRIITLIIV